MTVNGVTTKYESINAAVAAAPVESYANGKAGQEAEKAVIKLLKDTKGGFDIGVETGSLATFKIQNVEINLNGYTLTLGEPLVGSPSTRTSGIRVLAYSKLNIYGGKIEGATALRGVQNYGAVVVEDVVFEDMDAAYDTIGNFGSVELKGNTVVPNGRDSAILNSSYTYSDDSQVGVKLTISDAAVEVGKIEVDLNESAHPQTGHVNAADPELVITAGNIESIKTTGEDKEVIGGVSGGTFTNAVPEDICAEGFIPSAQGTDGKYSVELYVPVENITLNKTTHTMNVTETVTLVATVTPDNATRKEVTWTTSDASVATVENGVVTAVAAGTATITATADGISTSCVVTVEVPVENITLNKTTHTMNVTETVTLVATVTPDNATRKEVTWTTSDASVATVENGVVTAVAAGTATITATADGISTSCVVTVNRRASNPSLSGGGGSATSYYKIDKPNAENGAVSISSEKAVKGKEITITVIPDEGYELDTIAVSDTKGNEIKLTEKDNGIYTFKMPAIAVKIEVSFKEKAAGTESSGNSGETDVLYDDIAETDYYYSAVIWAAENGITNGTAENKFSPMKSNTRAEMVTFLWRAAGCPEQNLVDTAFTDVDKDSYYYEALLWATANGITQGTSETTFEPDKVCSRAEMVTFLYRFSNTPSVTGTSTFVDVNSQDYFNNAVIWAQQEAITQGTSETTFSPEDLCTRAQTVTFIYRLLVK